MSDRLRVGRKLGLTLYVQKGPEPSDDDEFIGTMQTKEWAERIVALDEKNERLRALLAEAVEWARRPSPIPIRPFNDFIDRAALASTGSEEPFDPAVYEELSRQRTKFDHQP